MKQLWLPILCHEDEVIRYFDVIPPYGIGTRYFSPDLASVGHICLAFIFLIVIIYKSRSIHIAFKFEMAQVESLVIEKSTKEVFHSCHTRDN